MMAAATRNSGRVLIYGLGLIAIYSAVHTCEQRESRPLPPPLRSSQPPINTANKEAKLVAFFEKQKSPVPDEMARAVIKRKRPRLLAAVAAVESNADTKAIGRAGEHGAFQVMPSIWGKVPRTAEGQADQAERILEQLIQQEHGRLKPALAKYNGGDFPKKVSWDYADRVMRLAMEITQ